MSKTLTSWISTAVCGRWFSSCSFSALITLRSRTPSVFVWSSKQFLHIPNEKRIYDCVTSYWLCEFVRQHGGEELFDNLRTLSAAGRLRQVLQSLCGNAEETVGVLLWWDKKCKCIKTSDGRERERDPTSYMMVFKFCCPMLCLFLPLSFLCSFRSVSSLNTWETQTDRHLCSHLTSSQNNNHIESDHTNLPHSYWA